MVRQFKTYPTAWLHMFLDCVALLVAFFCAIQLRFSFPYWLPYQSVSDIYISQQLMAGIVLAWPIASRLSGLYGPVALPAMLWKKWLQSCLLTFLFVVTGSYFLLPGRYSRGTLLLWLFLGLAFTGVLRRLNRWCYQGLLYWRLYKPKRVVLLGHGPWAEQLKKNLSDKSLFNFLTCLGWFTIEQTADEATLAKGCLGHWLQLPGYLEQARAQRLPVDEIVLAFPATETQTLSQILNILEDEVVDIRVVPDFTPYIRLCGAMQDFLGFPSMLVQTTPLYGFARLMKRLCDVLISGILLILLFPLFLVLACCVFVSDPGPIFYGQERVGLDQLPFKMWKFRTMRIDAESSGAQMAKDDWDPRCTWIGHYLRRFSLDELPQLWHVFCGEMSLVGPRPERPIFIQRFKQEIPRYLLRHKMKSGMTGWAQVNGWRGNTDMFKRIEMDLYYIENWSLTFDLKILLKTLCGGFISRASSAKMAPCPRRLT